MGNDDAHDVLHPNDVGRKFTMINSPSLNKEDIISNLKKGNCYGVDFYPKMDVPLEERIERIKHTPIVQSVKLRDDTLFVAVNKEAIEIEFIGQQGIIRHTAIDTNRAHYVIRKDDSYLRTVFRFADGSSVYLNPIIRHDGDHPVSTRTAMVDQSATLGLRITYFLVALTIVYIYSRRRQRKSVQNK
jgi:hypothetical protein